MSVCDGFNEQSAGLPAFNSNNDWPTHNGTINESHVFSASLVNLATFMVARNTFIRGPQVTNPTNWTGLGCQSCMNIAPSGVPTDWAIAASHGMSIGHPPLRPFRVRASENRHPITQGMSELVVNDEQHYAEYDKDKKYILLEAENVDGLTYENLGSKSISGWAYEFGSGRVVFTAVGHTIHAMWTPQYLEIQKRSIRRLLRQI
jgi:type 1 glutamine amidotransferase